MSDTPRTDAKNAICMKCIDVADAYRIMAEHAEQIEREMQLLASFHKSACDDFFALCSKSVAQQWEIHRLACDLSNAATEDYAGMRDMQAKFMKADHELREAREVIRVAYNLIVNHHDAGAKKVEWGQPCPICHHDGQQPEWDRIVAALPPAAAPGVTR